MAKGSKENVEEPEVNQVKVNVGDSAASFFSNPRGALVTGTLIGASSLGLTALLFFH